MSVHFLPVVDRIPEHDVPLARMRPFQRLRPFAADLIVVDPPWLYQLRSRKGETKSPQAHYKCMKDAAIKALPIELLAAPDCWLFLWATAPKLDFAVECLRAWRFTYKSMKVWRKTTVNGRQAMGPGFIVRSKGEVVLIGTIGNPRRTKALDGLFDGVRREHSRKPEEFYERLEEFAPDARKLDLFGRQTRPGWTVWGNQATRFDTANAAAGGRILDELSNLRRHNHVANALLRPVSLS